MTYPQFLSDKWGMCFLSSPEQILLSQKSRPLRFFVKLLQHSCNHAEWVGLELEDVHRIYIKLGKETSQKASDALPKI